MLNFAYPAKKLRGIGTQVVEKNYFLLTPHFGGPKKQIDYYYYF